MMMKRILVPNNFFENPFPDTKELLKSAEEGNVMIFLVNTCTMRSGEGEQEGEDACKMLSKSIPAIRALKERLEYSGFSCKLISTRETLKSGIDHLIKKYAIDVVVLWNDQMPEIKRALFRRFNDEVSSLFYVNEEWEEAQLQAITAY